MKKVKASRNKAAAVETKKLKTPNPESPNIELDNMSSEDLGLLLGRQWLMLSQAKGNINAITQTLEKRKVKKDD